MDLADLVDRSFGPRPLNVSDDAVSDFISVTGDDASRWTEAAPPGFAAAALFEVAPELLQRLSDHSVVHGEQTFVWNGPLSLGATLEVTGTVTRVRERGGVHFVVFELVATHRGASVLEGSSLFVISGEALPGRSDYERPEPPHSHRGQPEAGQVSASRDDLVRYAAATRDWNPIHWDHDAAVAAGFPGVVVHGLLQAAWAFVRAVEGTTGSRPLTEARVRFRNPLLPARPVSVTAERENSSVEITIADEDNLYLTAKAELADE